MSRSAPRDGCLSSVDAVDAGCAPRGVEGVDGVDDIDGVDGVGSSTAPKSASVRRRRLALAPSPSRCVILRVRSLPHARALRSHP